VVGCIAGENGGVYIYITDEMRLSCMIEYRRPRGYI